MEPIIIFVAIYGIHETVGHEDETQGKQYADSN
jgi:hypothetical protein